MLVLILGLVLFLGVHSVRIFADAWRMRMIKRLGEGPWKGLYSLASLAGFVLVIVGYGLTRQSPVDLWNPPTGLKHLATLFTIPAFVLLAAAYVPGNAIRAKLRHPMVLGTKLWAFAHLLANGRLGDVVLFGAFLLWAILEFRALRQRDRAEGKAYPAGSAGATMAAVAVGLAAWAGFAFWAHGAWIGVRPFG
ncbi:MAG: NnrU family protein [Betaproteobacteria bacterium]|jgi:uncharacterized membrane protein|nr:NnrU family protein [Rhodocyclaceae bacterium]MCA3134103.1 NnrU family protein [Rhodocyclaceae bacterium]MCA3142605.1 NnrU family protein [Rhodocyclaceae bacterium]MCA3144354.1 NnrU family protein [Rhodocyclaceae bacterium]MCE2897418.1 NnrU family protein [Betaproteobacteria bacterium]